MRIRITGACGVLVRARIDEKFAALCHCVAGTAAEVCCAELRLVSDCRFHRLDTTNRNFETP